MRLISLLLSIILAAGLPLFMGESQAQEKGVRKGLAIVPPKELGGPEDNGPLYHPFDTVQFAYQDMLSITAAWKAAGSPDAAHYVGVHPHNVRYISLYNYPRPIREKVAQSTAWVINSMSVKRQLRGPGYLLVPGTDGTLMRVVFSDFGWPGKAWDNLAELGSGPELKRQADPYFHFTIEQGGFEIQKVEKTRQVARRDGYGRTYYVNETYHEEKKVEVPNKKTFAAAPWLAMEKEHAKLGSTIGGLALMCDSTNPILRADYFLANAFVTPRYYEFFGLKAQAQGGKEQDFRNIFGVDEKAVAKFASDLGAVSVDSRVTHNPRKLLRFPTIIHPGGGFYWESQDAKAAIGKRNLMKRLLNAQFDAKEIIALLPNGLQAYAVTDDKGNLVDVADADIALDFNTPLKQKLIYPGRNCATCHDTGMWDIQDRVRELSRGDIAALVPDPKEAVRIGDLFFSFDIKPLVQLDSVKYEASVTALTGLKSVANTKQYEQFLYSYLDKGITMEQVAYEVGLPVDKILRHLKGAVGPDHTLSGLLQKTPIPIRRDLWESDGFPELMLLLQSRRAWDNPIP